MPVGPVHPTPTPATDHLGPSMSITADRDVVTSDEAPEGPEGPEDHGTTPRTEADR